MPHARGRVLKRLPAGHRTRAGSTYPLCWPISAHSIRHATRRRSSSNGLPDCHTAGALGWTCGSTMFVGATYAAARAPSPDGIIDCGRGTVTDGAAPLIGSSAAMRALRHKIERVAATNFTVLRDGGNGAAHRARRIAGGCSTCRPSSWKEANERTDIFGFV